MGRAPKKRRKPGLTPLLSSYSSFGVRWLFKALRYLMSLCYERSGWFFTWSSVSANTASNLNGDCSVHGRLSVWRISKDASTQEFPQPGTGPQFPQTRIAGILKKIISILIALRKIPTVTLGRHAAAIGKRTKLSRIARLQELSTNPSASLGGVLGGLGRRSCLPNTKTCQRFLIIFGDQITGTYFVAALETNLGGT